MNNALCGLLELTETDQYNAPKIFIGNEVLKEDQLNYDSIRMLIKRHQENEDIAPWERISIENKGEK